MWKGILEDFFADFLRMIFEKADDIFDFSRGFTFLEQELSEIKPGYGVKHPKVVDKLVGVFVKSGEKLWVRVHIEVQGNAHRDFGRRMFKYFSRIFDKHEPVISIAVFLEKGNKNNTPVYKYSYHGTSVEFIFNTCYVADLDEQKLSRSVNPFSKVLLAAKLVTQRELSVQDIFDKKKAIARQLLALDLPAEKIRRLLDFLIAYVHFEEKEINNKFGAELELLTVKKETMGITEQILDIAKQDGIREGKNASREIISKNLLKKGLDIYLIHEVTAMPIKKLEELKRELLRD